MDARAPSKNEASVFGLVWKVPGLVIALMIGCMAASTVGWNGGAWILGGSDDSAGTGGFINHALLVVGAAASAAILYFVFRIAKWALWGFVPLMAYAALVLGVWNGLASGFDATRAAAIQHHYANAYALKHMSAHARALSCQDVRIALSDDAKAVCDARR